MSRASGVIHGVVIRNHGTVLRHLALKTRSAFALSSHQKMANAYDEGFFDDMLTPYLGLTRDNNVRKEDTSHGEACKIKTRIQ